ncbi:MAG: zinc-dependent peptidase [Kiritimatiellae bacterium]|nr:zinc-dependent peptidase [Kiritimatiellia bacterium]MDD5520246.1 zinc-dependent peptidase [Kiritimatiellia bacterium]
MCFFVTKKGLRFLRRKQLFGMSFPDSWKNILVSNVPLYRYLPEELKEQLHGYINIFLSEKRFEGCGGIEITDQIRVTIAALACVLLLNRKTDYYPRLKSILVYPHPYVVEHWGSIGSTRVHGWSFRVGESWSTGAVVIAWDEVNRQVRDVDDGHNVVLHEFAHQLDEEDGTGARGTPILGQKSSYVTWARILGREYRNLQEKVSRNEQDIMDEYGATNEAEFFAVATETFFEKPLQFRKIHPALYSQLKDYYQLDPARWFKG